MRLKIDQNADALYLSLRDDFAHESEEVAPGIIVDFDLEGRAVGIEMLYLSTRGITDLNRLIFETVPFAASAA